MRCKAGLAKPVDEVNESVKMVTHALIGVKLGVWVNLVLSKLRFLANIGIRINLAVMRVAHSYKLLIHIRDQ